MQAVILAAGKGSRLKDKTKNIVKCMVEVNGESMISRVLSQLDNLNLHRIIVVDGYLKEVLENYILTLKVKTPIEFISNDRYDSTNNIYSVFLAKEKFCEEETILIESDLIFNDSLIPRMINSEAPNIAAVSKFQSWMDGTVIRKDQNDNILSFVGKDNFDFSQQNTYYKTVNIYKFSENFSRKIYFPYLEAQMEAFGLNEYYETALRTVTTIDSSLIKALDIEDEVWYEIDDVQDLDIAESLFAKDKYEKLSKMERRYGGYWRYPNLIDFCYLVNPFFPPKKMLEEFTANVNRLITDYPSGLNVNTSLVSKYYDIPEEELIVGNGAAELIKALLENLEGNLGVIAPTFEEYPNRRAASQVIKMYAPAPTFSYTAEQIINYFDDKEISALVLINPDNPSGNYLTKTEVLRVLDWCLTKDITLILDESFNDFVDIEKVPSLIDKDVLCRYPNLIIIKSISKSFGVPGVRLGFLCSGDRDLIRILKKKVSIWNINSFGEFFLQIFEKYKKDYLFALENFYEVREQYKKSLEEIEGIRLVPSQSNYFMVQLLKGNARELAADLLDENIFIKDLSKKDGIKETGEFIRLAVKTPSENKKLVYALKKYFSE